MAVATAARTSASSVDTSDFQVKKSSSPTTEHTPKPRVLSGSRAAVPVGGVGVFVFG